MAAPALSRVGGPRRKSRFTKLDLIGWLFISPWVIGFLVFTAFPFLASLFLSFTDWAVVGAWHWIGTQNYQNMVNGTDFDFWTAVRVTLTYAVVTIPGSQIIALLLALLLNRKAPGIAFFRTLFFIPAIASGVGTAYLWALVFSNPGGLLNSALAFIGIQGPNWLYSLTWSLPALMIVGMWNVGTSMLIYLAALQGVPQSLYDAAAVDGATWWIKFTTVTIPMITPGILFNLVLGVIGSFQSFTAAFIITNGGPGTSTLLYALYLYKVAFQNLQMGYASALAWVLFLVILVVTVIQLALARLWVYYEGAAPTAGGAVH